MAECGSAGHCQWQQYVTVADGAALTVGSGTGRDHARWIQQLLWRLHAPEYRHRRTARGQSLPSSIASDGIIGFHFTGSLDFGIPITGFGGATKAGSGMLTLSAANTAFTPVSRRPEARCAPRMPPLWAAAPSRFPIRRSFWRMTAGTLLWRPVESCDKYVDDGDRFVTSDRLTAGPGVTHSMGFLFFNGTTLTLNAGPHVTSGVAGLTFSGATLGTNQIDECRPECGSFLWRLLRRPAR